MYSWNYFTCVSLEGVKITKHWTFFLRISSNFILCETFKLKSWKLGSWPSNMVASTPTLFYFDLVKNPDQNVFFISSSLSSGFS